MILTAQEVKAARQKLGMSQYQLSRLLGVSRPAVYQWESGNNQCTYSEEIQRLLKGAVPAKREVIELPHGMCVYIIKAGNAVKVGHTKNLKRRMQNLQVGSPVELTLVGYVRTPNALATEKLIHKMLERYRIHGEWYTPPATALLTITAKYRVFRVDLDYSKVVPTRGRNIIMNKAG